MSGYRLDRLWVLIVDDNQSMRSLVRTVLEALGVRNIIEARDGEHAIEKITRQEVNLIITDWVMDEMDGLQLTRWVRNEAGSPDPYVPIIMLTGHTDRAKVMEARDAGVTEFMAKPVSAKALYSRMVAIIENPRPFVKTDNYFGPDRRRKNMPYQGPDRRKQIEEDEDDGAPTRRAGAA
ncbi:MAG: response regulator [Thalassobaculales bacterium]